MVDLYLINNSVFDKYRTSNNINVLHQIRTLMPELSNIEFQNFQSDSVT